MRRGAVALFVLVAAACGGDHAAPRTTAASSADAARALAIADEVLAESLAREPQRAALLRLPGARYDDLPGETPEAYAAREAREDRWAAELARMDPRALAPAGTTSKASLARDVAREVLEGWRVARVCRFETWSVSQTMNGWQVKLTNLAAAQPVGTPELRAQTLARWSKAAPFVDANVAQLRRGLAEGRVASEVAVKDTLEQLDKLLAEPTASSPLTSPAQRDPDPAFRAALEGIVDRELRPAIVRYRALLETELLPRARKSPGLASLPDGAACYLAMLRANTTLEGKTPGSVHAEGLAQLEALEQEMRALSAAHFGGASPRALFERFRTDPAHLYRSREDVVAQARAAYERAHAALPRAFGVLPRADMKIEPIPAFQEKTMAAHYLLPAVDGSRPGTYRIRLYEAEKASRVDGESTAFHEGVPGHHLQLALAVEHEENPAIARFVWSNAAGEGWALYAERLADELGLFSSPEARFGMLAAFSFRATRLVVDTGIHAMGWSRERAIDELLAHTPMGRTQASAEVDRYIAWPGQATSYMIGYLHLRELRRRAEARLGARFDLRAFHDELLASGSAPLPVIEKRIDAFEGARAR